MAGGRPPKYTPEVAEQIFNAIRQGNYQVIAAKWAGIGETTLTHWKKRYPEFRQGIQEAEAAAEIKLVALIMKAAPEDPKHAEWLLSHRHPERWAASTKVTGAGGEPLIPKYTKEQLKSISTGELETLLVTIEKLNNARDTGKSDSSDDS